jgi:hypothetical protein
MSRDEMNRSFGKLRSGAFEGSDAISSKTSLSRLGIECRPCP